MEAYGFVGSDGSRPSTDKVEGVGPDRYLLSKPPGNGVWKGYGVPAQELPVGEKTDYKRTDLESSTVAARFEDPNFPYGKYVKEASHGSGRTQLHLDGALLGAGWEWLSAKEDDLRGIGVVVPEGWEWGGQWFEVARNLPSLDAAYLAALPLTLHIEELHTYLVHAGMCAYPPSHRCERH